MNAMLDEVLVLFGLGIVGFALTNFDNLALLVTLIPVMGRLRAVTAFWLAQGLTLTVALAAAAGLSAQIADPGPIVALLPICIGLWRLVSRGQKGDSARGTGSWFAAVAVFLLLTGDSFAVFASLLADTAPGLQWAVLLSAISTGIFMGLMATELARYEYLSHLLDRAAPWLMIGIGLYIFVNSATDVVQ